MREDVEISKLITHPSCCRDEMPEAWVAELQAVLRDGRDFNDPIIVYEGAAGRMIVAAGNCRLEAAKREGRATIDADVRRGELRDAILCSVGSDIHGERRTPRDNRKSVATMLLDPEWVTWPDSQIARAVGCSDKTVTDVRRELEGRSEIPSVSERTDSMGRKQPARKPRTSPAELPPAPAPEVRPSPASPLLIGDRDRPLPFDDELDAVLHSRPEPEPHVHIAGSGAHRRVAALDSLTLTEPPTAPAPAIKPKPTDYIEDSKLSELILRVGRAIDARSDANNDRGRGFSRSLDAWRALQREFSNWLGK